MGVVMFLPFTSRGAKGDLLVKRFLRWILKV
jgi:hypothetical protein